MTRKNILTSCVDTQSDDGHNWDWINPNVQHSSNCAQGCKQHFSATEPRLMLKHKLSFCFGMLHIPEIGVGHICLCALSRQCTSKRGHTLRADFLHSQILCQKQLCQNGGKFVTFLQPSFGDGFAIQTVTSMNHHHKTRTLDGLCSSWWSKKLITYSYYYSKPQL